MWGILKNSFFSWLLGTLYLGINLGKRSSLIHLFRLFASSIFLNCYSILFLKYFPQKIINYHVLSYRSQVHDGICNTLYQAWIPTTQDLFLTIVRAYGTTIFNPIEFYDSFHSFTVTSTTIFTTTSKRIRQKNLLFWMNFQ